MSAPGSVQDEAALNLQLIRASVRVLSGPLHRLGHFGVPFGFLALAGVGRVSTMRLDPAENGVAACVRSGKPAGRAMDHPSVPIFGAA